MLVLIKQLPNLTVSAACMDSKHSTMAMFIIIAPKLATSTVPSTITSSPQIPSECNFIICNVLHTILLSLVPRLYLTTPVQVFSFYRYHHCGYIVHYLGAAFGDNRSHLCHFLIQHKEKRSWYIIIMCQWSFIMKRIIRNMVKRACALIRIFIAYYYYIAAMHAVTVPPPPTTAWSRMSSHANHTRSAKQL